MELAPKLSRREKKKKSKVDGPPPAIDAAQEIPEDNRPAVSPYTSATAELLFGTEAINYCVPTALLPSSIAPDRDYYGYRYKIYLSNIDPDIAHPLVHFLHTGKYETLRSGQTTLLARNTREHQRALSLYVVASKYGLRDLQALAMEKVLSIGPGIPARGTLKHLETVLPETSDDDEFLAAYLTDTLKRAFSEPTDPAHEAPHEQLSSRFARAVVNSVAVIFADMQARVSQEDKTRHLEESYHMPAPPEEPAVEAECPSPCGMANSEGLTHHDSFSVISCDGGKEATGSDRGRDDAGALSINTASDGLEPESCEDAQPPEGADAEGVPEPAVEEKIADECRAGPADVGAEDDDWGGLTASKKKKKKKKQLAAEEEPVKPPPAAVEWPAEAAEDWFGLGSGMKKKKKKGKVAMEAEEVSTADAVTIKPQDNYPCVVEPEIVEDMAAPPPPPPELIVEEAPPPAPEIYVDEWGFTHLPKKEKKSGQVTTEPVTDECRHRAEHLTAGWESCNMCRGFVLSVVQEEHRKISEARYG